MTRAELVEPFTIEGIHRSNAVVNFTEEDPFDPKAVWLNSQHIYGMTPGELAPRLAPFLAAAGYEFTPEMLLAVTPLVRERIKLLRDAAAVADFFFLKQLAPYDAAELIPQKGDASMALGALRRAAEVLATAGFEHAALEETLRAAAAGLGIKPGQMFQPIRVAVCGRKNAPPLFQTLEVLGRDTCLRRIREAADFLASLNPGEPAS
jgi:glutamyl-tRNA synthetase